MRRVSSAWPLLAFALAGLAAPAAAEPIFLSRQYTRCTNCHFSPTGGGLLTPYGRSLSREELSATGRGPGSPGAGREHEFLFGALGGSSGPLSLGLELWPSHLRIATPEADATRSMLMNAELIAALRRGNWTFYAELGRQPRGADEHRVDSFEHWASYRAAGGLGVRAGRFLPAYGVKLSDHTALTRAPLGLDTDDQVYAVELSYSSDRQLVQLSAGPGFADRSAEHDGRRSFTATGRWQLDLTSRAVLVASGLFRDASDGVPRSGAAGLAFGFAPAQRLALWTQADTRFRAEVGETPGQRAYTLLGEAAFEAYRGVWIKVSPQLATEFGDDSAGTLRLSAALDLLPRTHWNVVVSYYRDRDRRTDRTTKVWLAQLHLYL